MTRLANGFVAGFFATVVLSLFMLMKQMMGMMPELDVVQMLTAMSGASTPLVGWAMHFMIGVFVWGGLFAVFEGRIPGENVVMRGVLFGLFAWLLMMIMVMPMAGAGLFGVRFGMGAPVMTLLLHVVFGATLGTVYGWRSVPRAV